MVHRLFCFLILLAPFSLLFSQSTPNEQAYELAQQTTAFTPREARQALPLLDSAQQICQQYDCADSTLAFVYRRLGIAYFQGGIDDQKALNYIDTARYFYRRYLGQEHPLIANTYYTSGIIKSFLGRQLEAIKAIDTAITILEGLPSNEVVGRDSILARWYQNSANKNIDWGDYSSGMLQREKAEFYNQRTSSTNNFNDCLFLRSLAYQNYQTGHFEKAYQYFSSTAECLAELPHEASSQLTLRLFMQRMQADCLGQMGQYEAALQQLATIAAQQRELALAESALNADLASTLHARSWFNLQLGNFTAAKQLYEEARQLHQASFSNDYHPSVADLFLLRGKIAQAEGDCEAALSFFDRSLASLAPDYTPGTPLEELRSTDYYILFLDLYDQRARCLAERGQEVAANDIYESMQRVVSRQRQAFRSGSPRYNVLRYAKPAYEQAIRLNLYPRSGSASPQQREKAWQYVSSNKGIGLREELQQEKALKFADIPRRVQQQEQDLASNIRELQKQLYAAYQNDAPQDSILLLLVDQEQNYYEFLKQLEQDYPRYYDLKYATKEPLRLSDVQAKLAQKQLALEYFWGADSLYIFAVSQQEMQVTAKSVKNGLADSVRLYYELLSTGVGPECERQFTQLSHFLYQQLIPSSLWTDQQQSFNRLLIIPDGLLHLVAFESLLERPLAQLNGSDGFLLERFAISYLPSVQSLLAPARTKRKYRGTFLGFGLEYDDATLAYLSDAGFGKKKGNDPVLVPCQSEGRKRELGKLVYSDDEVQRVGAQIGGEVRLNHEATKRTFMEQAGNYDILHLAMHGTYDLEYPLNSSLLFSYQNGEDVALRAAEIYGLTLDAEMVVLSACNTAYGQLAEGEGVMSLARAFNYAGSNSMVASLWTAVDYSTAEIMVLFYQYLNDGLPKDEALQQAKLDFLQSNSISSPSTRQPYHWASTVMIGSTAPLANSTSSKWYWLLASFIAVLAFFLWKKKK